MPRLADFRMGYKAGLISPTIVAGLTRAAELTIITLIGAGIFELYVNRLGDQARLPYGIAAMTGALATVLAFEMLGLYKVPALRAPWRHFTRFFASWTVVFGILLASAFFFKVGVDFSRVWLASWFAAGAVAVTAFRGLIAGLVRAGIRHGRLVRRVAIVGAGPDTESLIASLEAEPESDIRICGLFDDRAPARVGHKIAGYPRLGSTDDVVGFCRRNRIDMLIVSLPLRAESRLLATVSKLLILPADITLAAHATRLRFARHAYRYVGNVPFIDIAERPIADWGHARKWLFDKLVGTLALIALSPVMLAATIAIRIDSRGPVLFKQKRYGFNNELIEVLKFRSMYHDMADTAAAKLVTKDDPRVTRVGRFIRKTTIDELPQLFNVLRGELSLVGPRPHAVQAKAADRLYQDVVDGYFARHRVKPGLTGWAQINGWRGETDTREKIEKRVECDLYYIENWSVLFDLYILARTPFALLKAENAY